MNKFLSFLESLKDKENSTLIESIKQGYSACFESFVRYIGDDPYTGEKGKEYDIQEEIPLRVFDKEEALTQIIEQWQRRQPDEKHMEYLMAKRPKVIVDNMEFFLTGHKGWNTLRKFAMKLFPDLAKRVEEQQELKVKTNEISQRNALRRDKMSGGGAISPKLVKREEDIKQGKMNRLERGLKRHMKSEKTDAKQPAKSTKALEDLFA